MAKAVVACSLLLVRQHVVSLGSLLELLLGLLITWILIGVILDSGLTIGLLYCIGIGILLDAENLIVISLLCHSDNPALLSNNNLRIAQHMLAELIASLHTVDNKTTLIITSSKASYSLLLLLIEGLIYALYSNDV